MPSYNDAYRPPLPIDPVTHKIELQTDVPLIVGTNGTPGRSRTIKKGPKPFIEARKKGKKSPELLLKKP